MPLKRIILPLIALTALAGCVEQQVATPGPLQIDHCGAAGYSGRVGTPLSTFDLSAVKTPLRVLAPNSIMTMDYRQDRMNIEHNKQGTITRIFCG